MKKPRKRRPTPEETVRTIINKMFEIAGHNATYDDVTNRTDNWWEEWTMTMAQDQEWKDWMTDYYKKECKLAPKLASRQAAMCSLMWGLKLSDYE
jgi:hypothetical protein